MQSQHTPSSIIIISDNNENESPNLIELGSNLPEECVGLPSILSELNDHRADEDVANLSKNMDVSDPYLNKQSLIDGGSSIGYDIQTNTVCCCLICNDKICKYINIFSRENSTKYSKRDCLKVLQEIVKKELLKENVHTMCVCLTCYKLLNDREDLLIHMQAIENGIKNKFFETLRKVESLQNACVNQQIEELTPQTQVEEKSAITSDHDMNFKVKTKVKKKRLKRQVKKVKDEDLNCLSNTLDFSSGDIMSEDLQTKLWSCDCCKFNTKSSAEFVKHRKSHFCHICDTQLSQPSKMKTHLSKVHNIKYGKTKNFQCNICFKMYSSNGGLHNHTKTVHSDEKYKCTVCKEVFGHPRILREHLVRHGEKKVFCAECNSSFYLVAELNKHKNSVHRKIRSYECTICHKFFCQRSSLSHHMSQHTSHQTSQHTGHDRGPVPQLPGINSVTQYQSDKQCREIADDVQLPFNSQNDDIDSPIVSFNLDLEDVRDRSNENDEVEIHLNFA